MQHLLFGSHLVLPAQGTGTKRALPLSEAIRAEGGLRDSSWILRQEGGDRDVMKGRSRRRGMRACVGNSKSRLFCLVAVYLLHGSRACATLCGVSRNDLGFLQQPCRTCRKEGYAHTVSSHSSVGCVFVAMYAHNSSCDTNTQRTHAFVFRLLNLSHL